MEEHTVWEKFACFQLTESRVVSVSHLLFAFLTHFPTQATANCRFRSHFQSLLAWKSSGQRVGSVAFIFLTFWFCVCSCTCWWRMEGRKTNEALRHNACEEGALLVKNGAGSNAWSNAIGTVGGRQQTSYLLDNIFHSFSICISFWSECIALKSAVHFFLISMNKERQKDTPKPLVHQWLWTMEKSTNTGKKRIVSLITASPNSKMLVQRRRSASRLLLGFFWRMEMSCSKGLCSQPVLEALHGQFLFACSEEWRHN